MQVWCLLKLVICLPYLCRGKPRNYFFLPNCCRWWTTPTRDNRVRFYRCLKLVIRAIRNFYNSVPWSIFSTVFCHEIIIELSYQLFFFHQFFYCQNKNTLTLTASYFLFIFFYSLVLLFTSFPRVCDTPRYTSYHHHDMYASPLHC